MITQNTSEMQHSAHQQWWASWCIPHQLERDMVNKYWMGSSIKANDDFGNPVKDVFVDGKTKMGPWAIMSPESWRIYGVGSYGTGYGQRYCKTHDGRWLKVEG
jgi:hypothetical protein